MIMCANGYKQNRYVNSRIYESMRGNFSETMSNAQSGKKNSQYGTRWIHNKETGANKKIKKDDNIPDGWLAGRVNLPSGEDNPCYGSRWIYNVATKETKKLMKGEPLPSGWEFKYNGSKKHFGKRRYKRKCTDRKPSKNIHKDNGVNERLDEWNNFLLDIEEKIKTEELYNKYKEGIEDKRWTSLRSFCKEIRYEYSHVTLYKRFSKYIKEYRMLSSERKVFRIEK